MSILYWQEFRDVAAPMSRLVHWLRGYLHLLGRAVVLDIDDTCMHMHRGRRWRVDPYILGLYRFLVQNDFYVFFVTARTFSEKNHSGTLRQLRHMGYTQCNGLFLMPDTITKTIQAIAAFKRAVRVHVQQTSLVTILLNIGNMWHDLTILESIQSDPGLVYTVKFEGDDSSLLHLKVPAKKNYVGVD